MSTIATESTTVDPPNLPDWSCKLSYGEISSHWPIGPLLAQSAHAATAVLHRYREHPDVRRYLEGDDGRGWEGMRKVVMEVPDGNALKTMAEKLDEMNNPIPYHLWVEQPENTPTALALIPNKRPKALKKIMDEVGCELFK